MIKSKMINDNILINYITNSFFSSRTYWLPDNRQNKFWLVDCGDIEEVIRQIPAQSVIAGVLLTHVHYDHIYGLNRLMKIMPDCVIYTNDFGQKSLTDPKRNFSRYHTDIDDFIFEHPEKVVVVGEGDKIELFEGVYTDVYYTPGHDESCLCYEVEENLFTGDAYIPGVKTVTTFPHSSKKNAMESDLRISLIARGMKVWPGHTISEDKK
jgi:glyoxylase-like metal-dependent hydrolase (beta-lactamase superfamily II)